MSAAATSLGKPLITKLALLLTAVAVNAAPPTFKRATLTSLLEEIKTSPKSITSVESSAIGSEGGSAITTSSICGLLYPYTLVPTKRTSIVWPLYDERLTSSSSHPEVTVGVDKTVLKLPSGFETCTST